FDNNADALNVLPLLLEKLQDAAQAIVTRALDTAPANAAVRSRIMICDPASAPGGEGACATRILAAFATRAFRRPVADADAARYATLIDVARAAGDGFEQGIAAALQAILLSPRFLFRIEARVPAGKVMPLDGYEVAARLSYFLWSSLPDQRLLDRAAAGQLATSEAIT